MKELPKLILNRDYVLATTKGHTVKFVKGEPTHVPAAVFQDAIAIGAQPSDGSDPDVLKDEKRPDAPPADLAERRALIMTAIEIIVSNNERKDFTAAGSPTVKAVERELKFDVDAREIASAWQEYHEKKAAQ